MPDLKTLRPLYVEKYGKDAWTRAVALATRHRGRASSKYGLTEHFTAWEWLDLCGQTDFHCFHCGVLAPLEAHHHKALGVLGTNLIGNIEPICAGCHKEIPIQESVRDVRIAWIEEQETAYKEGPCPGTLVGVARGHSRWRLGVVVSTSPAAVPTGPLWGRLPNVHVPPLVNQDGVYMHGIEIYKQGHLDYYNDEALVQPPYTPALSYVQWIGEQNPTPIRTRRLPVLNVLSAKEAAARWFEEQDKLIKSWPIGTWGRSVDYKTDEMRGIVRKLISPTGLPLTGFTGEADLPLPRVDWVPGEPAIARVKCFRKVFKPKIVSVPVCDLVRLDEDLDV